MISLIYRATNPALSPSLREETCVTFPATPRGMARAVKAAAEAHADILRCCGNLSQPSIALSGPMGMMTYADVQDWRYRIADARHDKAAITPVLRAALAEIA